jgi:alpha-glucosidase (family GH31 glycosyl hydrolase)
VSFDGIWLDINEVSNDCDGVCYEYQRAKNPLLYQLPYIPTGRSLEDHALSLDAIHETGVKELEAHSLFSTMETKATHDWFESQEKRTFVISRGAYAGMGKYGSRWLGDNWSDYSNMALSVS